LFRLARFAISCAMFDAMLVFMRFASSPQAWQRTDARTTCLCHSHLVGALTWLCARACPCVYVCVRWPCMRILGSRGCAKRLSLPPCLATVRTLGDHSMRRQMSPHGGEESLAPWIRMRIRRVDQDRAPLHRLLLDSRVFMRPRHTQQKKTNDKPVFHIAAP
jgi:hypothetical protein